MAKPKISVITPSFNQGRYIKDTIESVLAQKYQPFEHIIMDGGSTDATLEILKSYSHLQWSSAPDKGQSDALNKALTKTTGDIIAWINSDDWYAEGAFDSVVAELENYPVVMGSCAIVDEQGNLQYEVPNIERTWFDLLRYWVPYSIPTQPAIFFRREVLAGLERGAGEMFDPELYYTMDYDLWTRMAIKAPFLKRVQKRFAYYRMTETNKTGDTQGGLTLAEPEMARIFKRAETLSLAPSTECSLVVPADQLSPELTRTIDSLLLQSTRDFEIVLVHQSGSPSAAKDLRDFVRQKNTEQNKSRRDSYLRLIASEGQSVPGAVAAGINAAEGRYVVVALPGAIFGSTFLADAAAALSSNRLGMLLPWKHSHEAYQSLAPSTSGGAIDFEVARLFDSPALPFIFVARRVALFECLDLLQAAPLQKIIRELISTFLFKGWHVSIQQELRVTTPEASAAERDYLARDRQRMVAELVVALEARRADEPFAAVRAAHGCALVFDPTVVENCRAILKS